MFFSVKQMFEDKTQKSSIVNLVVKPISILLGMVYTPLLLSYLGEEKYGLWSTILAIVSWINYCDVGIGHGLRNALTKDISLKKYDEAQQAISTAYVVLSIIALLIWIIAVVVIVKSNLYAVFNTDINLTAPFLISITFICINFILSLCNIILYSLQQSEYVAIRNCIIQVLNIIGILILKTKTKSSIVAMSILFGSTSLIVYLSNTLSIFYHNVSLVPRFDSFNRKIVNSICNLGLKFFLIQISCIALYTVDNILISNMYGGKAVTPFSVVNKLFNALYSCLSAFCIPYWSRMTQAVVQKEICWITEAAKKLRRIALLFIICFILLAIVCKPILKIWLRRELEIPSGLIPVMCLYYCLYSIVTVNVQLINGTGRLNFQLFLMTFMGIANIPLSIFLARNCNLGVVGIRLATTILMGIAAVAFPINLNKIIKSLECEERN
jgi:O-antigen/teichoic acid export membrane protein